jgi:RAQPRD family integrative conjugative element protein
MTQRRPVTSTWLCLQAIALVTGLSALSVTSASDTAVENVRLATLVRQLDMIDRMAQTSENLAPARTRYHFDYARFRFDIGRVRAGIEDYLKPSRAQPRDPEALSAEYRREEAADK